MPNRPNSILSKLNFIQADEYHANNKKPEEIDYAAKYDQEQKEREANHGW